MQSWTINFVISALRFLFSRSWNQFCVFIPKILTNVMFRKSQDNFLDIRMIPSATSLSDSSYYNEFNWRKLVAVLTKNCYFRFSVICGVIYRNNYNKSIQVSLILTKVQNVCVNYRFGFKRFSNKKIFQSDKY